MPGEKAASNDAAGGNSPSAGGDARSFCGEIAGVSVAYLAQTYGTPLYVYDETTIHQRIDELRAFDVIRYAQKACSNLAILDLMRRAGVLVDAVSAGEVHRAVRAGFALHGDPPPVVYTADVFDRESLQLCADQQLHVNCDAHWLHRHGRPVGATIAGRQSDTADQSRLWTWAQPKDQYWRPAIETRDLARTTRRVFAGS